MTPDPLLPVGRDIPIPNAGSGTMVLPTEVAGRCANSPGRGRPTEEVIVAERTCSIAGCEASAYGRGTAHGWCSKHYKRWRRHGNPVAGRIPDGETARYFLAHVGIQTDECLIWPYAVSSGYGCATIDGRSERVHVLACEWAHGPRPEGMDAAHSCDVRRCFNPAHLRWATRTENILDRWRSA